VLKKSKLVPDDAKLRLKAFLSEDEDQDPAATYDAPEANAYEFQSQGIVDMLMDLIKKFREELATLEKEERNSRNAYEMLMQDLTSSIENSQEGLEKDRGDKAKALKNKAGAEGDLVDTTTVRDDDQKYLDDTTATCAQSRRTLKHANHSAPRKLRPLRRPLKLSRAKLSAALQRSTCQHCFSRQARH